jgi:hypothetical protein
MFRSRDEDGPIGLWQSLPDCYLDAETYTDFWEAYDAIFYKKMLLQVGKVAVPRLTETLVAAFTMG